MSINSAMLAGVSGLVSNSSAMAVISDNIANVNTTAFKRNRTDFSRLVNAQNGSTTYNAGGVAASTRQLIRSQGNLNSTSVGTDIALQGQGFFVVSSKAGSFSAGNTAMFTRDGSFAPDSKGNLVNQAGWYLHGWPVNDDGSVNGSPSDLTSLSPINLSSISGTVEPSDRAVINGNLRSSTPIGVAADALYQAVTAVPPVAPGAGAYSPTTNSMAMNSLTPNTGVRPDTTWSFQVYDSLGTLRTFNVGLLKSGTANQWHAEIWAPPNVIETGAGLTDNQIAVGTLAFTPSGELDLTATSPSLLNAFNFRAFDDTTALGANEVKWATSTGVAAQTFTLDIGQDSAVGGVTQFDSPTVVTSTSTNGAVFGDLAGVEIDAQGYITAQFNNGARRRLYQLPIATFINPDGLRAEAGGTYGVTGESGNFNLKQAGTGGAGEVASFNLEASTVDLALEFSNMIITQRAYSASSKIITTADEMMDELIRMKR